MVVAQTAGSPPSVEQDDATAAARRRNSYSRLRAHHAHRCVWFARVRRRLLRHAVAAVADRGRHVVRVHAAVPTQRVPAVGPRGRRCGGRGRPTAVAHTAPAQRPDPAGQAAGPGHRRVPAASGRQLFRLPDGQRPTQLQPVLLVLSRTGNHVVYLCHGYE